MIGAVALVVTFASDLAGAFAGIVAAPVYAATIYGLAVRGGIVGRFLESRAMVYAGEASFALYMTHAVVERSFAAHLDVEGLASFGLAGRAGVLALYVFVVLLVAVLSYECIEQPSRNVMRRWSALPRVRLPVRQLGFGRAHSSRR
jgi:peptidoglycan/LPS O-acetylase OafA/YrhL